MTKKLKEYKLEPSIFVIFLFVILALIFCIAGFYGLSKYYVQSIIAFAAMLFFIGLILWANKLTVDNKRIIISKYLLPLKKEFLLKDIKSVKLKQIKHPTYPTFVLEINSKKVHRLDIRVHYSDSDFGGFLKALKLVLGKKFIVL